ncbi:MAG: hypothetical protein ACTSRZ_08840 [Promethearchaeota archaeon]
MPTNKYLRIEYDRVSDKLEPVKMMQKLYPEQEFPQKPYAFKEFYYVRLDYIEEVFAGPEGFSIYGINMKKLFGTMWNRIKSISTVYIEDIIQEISQMPGKEKSPFYRDLSQAEFEILEESKKRAAEKNTPKGFI